MPDQTPARSSDPQIAAAVQRLHQLNDQLGVFHATRRILDDHPRSTSPAVKQIRALYEAFDQKHPNTTGGGEQ